LPVGTVAHARRQLGIQFENLRGSRRCCEFEIPKCGSTAFSRRRSRSRVDGGWSKAKVWGRASSDRARLVEAAVLHGAVSDGDGRGRLLIGKLERYYS